nr:unnamed protein product [Callosobruchus chinensis]
MIPALEGTSLESNCESVSRSWTPSKKASTSKLGLDPSEIFPHNVTLICVDKNAATDTDLSLNSNMIPALEGTSLKSNCESVSRSWKSPIKASTSKPTLENCWKKQLALPEIEKKSLNIRKEKKKVPYCITKAEWREIQEKKENEKEQQEIARLDKAKKKELKKLETPKTRKNNPKKKTKVKASDEPIESRITCPECKQLFEDPPNEDWIMCASCEKWWHENCTSYLGRGEFLCDEC